MKEDSMEFLLDDKKLKKAYKRAKLLSTFRTIIIVILVIIPLYIGFTKINVRVTYKMGLEYYDEVQKILDITKPNAYVSKVNDIIGFFGASGQYTVSKVIGRKSVELYSEDSRYGLVGIIEPNRVFMTSVRGGGHTAGEWPVNFDLSGNLNMMAFHPDIQYKEYKNDLDLLHKISPDSLLEMTLSLDKKYKPHELSSILPNVNISEILIDGYSKEQMDKYRMEAMEYSGKATFIREYDFIRLGMRTFGWGSGFELQDKYNDYLEKLLFNYKLKYHKDRFTAIYNTLKDKEQLDIDKVDIIGVVVYGNPEELQNLRSNPHIKASSAGVITKDVIFK
jgi:hypothetical protein